MTACIVCGADIGGAGSYGKKTADCSHAAFRVARFGIVQTCSERCSEYMRHAMLEYVPTWPVDEDLPPKKAPRT